MYNSWYNRPYAYGLWKRDAEADSEAKPWWNTYASAYGWNGMYNGWYNRPYAYGLWKRDPEADSEAKPWWNTYASTYGWNGMYNGWNSRYPRSAAYGYWKRDADAEAKPWWNTYGWNGMNAWNGWNGYSYGWPMYHYKHFCSVLSSLTMGISYLANP